MARPRKIKVVERTGLTLNDVPVWGIAWKRGFRVEIDPEQSAKPYLDTLIHEHLHILFPGATEDKVIASAEALTRAIWAKQYRRIER